MGKSFKDTLLKYVPTDGSSIGNKALMQKLRWGEDKYNNVKEQLIYEGKLLRATGHGGSVKRNLDNTVEELISTDATININGDSNLLQSEDDLEIEAISHNKIFIVHGHDDAVKYSVCNFLKQLELEPIILHDQVNSGRTIIEKFEQESLGVNFAIVLLTPDDEGKSIRELTCNKRARQNVILEFGFFIGKLGRDRVIALVSDNEIEKPSDYNGVIYIDYDKHEGWHKKLAKELKKANYNIDMNKL